MAENAVLCKKTKETIAYQIGGGFCICKEHCAIHGVQIPIPRSYTDFRDDILKRVRDADKADKYTGKL